MKRLLLSLLLVLASVPVASQVTTVMVTCQPSGVCAGTLVTTPAPVVNADANVVWSDWQAGVWSACVNSAQTRTLTRVITAITTPATGTGKTPASPETKTETQACTVPSPPPSGGKPTRRLQAGDVVYQGSFALPDMQDTFALSYIGSRQYCAYTQGIIAFNPANQSLFFVCHNWTQSIAEIKIPALGGTATQLQAPSNALEGRIGDINPTDPNSKNIGGLLVSGGKLLIAAYSYYDGSASATASHFVRSTNLSATGTLQGPFRVGAMNPAFYAGAFAPIPAVWQSALGGDTLNGQCCLGIISRTSSGPSASSVTLADLLVSRNPSPATMLVGYPEGHATLSSWSDTSLLFNGTTMMRGVLMPEGTASVLFFGRQGLGTFCYGTGSACNDPDDGSKGVHAYPYQPQVWAYDANDLAAVKAGAKQPWDVKPYATWKLPGFAGSDVGGVAVDVSTGRIFVTENGAGGGGKPLVRVYKVN